MSSQEVITLLESLGDPKIKSVLSNHGSPITNFGVRIGDMKPIQKKIKKNYELALELYDSGIPDVQYFAGLIADESRMTIPDLERWVRNATWQMVSEYTVPWVAAESKHGWTVALHWIDASEEHVQASGWCTLSSLLAMSDPNELNMPLLCDLMQRVADQIHRDKNRVSYCMNGFLIALGGYVPTISSDVIALATQLGKIEVNMGQTACKVPYAPEYISKMTVRGVKRKKTVRC